MDRKVALVTGSTSGIGLGIARRLAGSGYDIIITGLVEDTPIEEIITSFRSSYAVNVTYVGGDLTDEKEIQELCSHVTEKYPDGVDILVNNAGINYRENTEDFPIDQWHKIMAVNLTAPFLLARYFIPFMKRKRWGRIVNTSSMMGLVSIPMRVPYSTTKAGLIGMTKGIALECAEFGITCNAICPGFVFTEILKHFVEQTAKDNSTSFEEAKAIFFNTRNPTRKPITIEQVAGLVTYLCSEEAASITGSELTIDAGYTAK